MKECPYCNKPLMETWSYCHYCNKPLISNLQINNNLPENQFIEEEGGDNTNIMNSKFSFNASESFYDFKSNIDKDFDAKIQKIEREIDDKMGLGSPIGSLLFEKASLYFSKKDYASALRTLESAVNNFQDVDDFLNMAICHNEIGLIEEELGFYDNSLYHFEKSIEFLKEIKDFEKLIKVYNNIANVYFLLKDIEHSYEFYDKAQNLAEKESLISEEIKTSSNLVDILFILNHYDKIERILNRNLDYFRQIRDPFGTIITLTKIGKLYYYLGSNNFDLSFKFLNESLELINKLKIDQNFTIENKAKLEWECFLYLGKLYLSQNKYKTAEDYLFKSLEAIRISEIESSDIKESIILESMGNLFEIKEDFKKSIEYYKLAGEIYFRFGDDLNFAEIKLRLAQIFLKFDELESINYYEEALAIFKDINYTKKVAETMHELGDLYVNNEMIELALSYFQEAKTYFMDLNDDFNVNLLNGKINSLINSTENFD